MSRTIVQTFPVIDTRVIEVEVPGIQGPKGPMGDLTPEAEAVRTEINQAKTDAQTAATQAAGSAEAAETSAENAEQAYQDTLTAKSDALSAIQEEADKQLGLIEDEGEEQTAAVQSEGTTAVTGVQIEAGKQIERIQKEGGLQVDRVEQTANDLLDRTTEEANKAADSAEAAEALLKDLRFRITKTAGFDHCQAASGGVSTLEVDPATMRSRLRKGIYFCGEMLDVDGRCGGYNLQFAWSTGHIAGENASRPE